MEELPIPMSRIELYLAVAAGMTGVTVPEEPMSRLEDFLAYIAGDTSVILPTPMSLTELWLNYVAGGALTDEMKLTGAYWIGAQKVDVRFFAVAGGMDGVELPQPQNRTEQYWAKIAETLPVHGVLKYATGTSITLTDVVRGITSLENVYGDTFQQTYTGKNLFNYQGVVNLALSTTIVVAANYRGYYIQANAGDTLTLSRATTTGNNRFRICFTMVEPANGVAFYDQDGVEKQFINADSLTSTSFTVPQDMHYVFIYLSNSGQDITESLKIQLETGSTATSYEPYCGGIASPNPDYPQDVNVVTGAQTVTVVGKNLFDKNIPLSKDFINATGGWSTSSTPSYINQEYDSITGGTTFQFSFSSRISSATIRFAEYNAAGTFIKRTLVETQTSLTTNVNTAKIIFSVDAYPSRYFDDLQIEIGPTATTYEAYKSTGYTVNLGSIELCKIGTYQDYIYKSGDDWYIHKDTTKVIYDGSENWVTRTGKSHTFQIGISTSIRGISNYFTNIMSSSFDIAPGMYAGNSNVLIISYPDMADVTAFKTWLGTHNLVFYEILSKPLADDQITDSTLISQLNALNSAVLPKPNATITVTPSGTNLAGALKISYYAEEE